MSTQTLVVIVACVWLSTGVTLAILMGRRGHNAFGWGIIGAVLGPLGALLAVEAVADEPSRARTWSPDAGIPGTGTIDVLVGIDGSQEARRALDGVVDLLGPQLRRLTLAAVMNYDRTGGEERVLLNELERQADRVHEFFAAHRAANTAERPPVRCGTVLLRGRPDEALATEAAEDGYDLLVVGSRGAGMSKAVLGSAAARLASTAKVPVLIAPAEA